MMIDAKRVTLSTLVRSNRVAKEIQRIIELIWKNVFLDFPHKNWCKTYENEDQFGNSFLPTACVMTEKGERA